LLSGRLAASPLPTPHQRFSSRIREESDAPRIACAAKALHDSPLRPLKKNLGVTLDIEEEISFQKKA
jgi:hypothetical protein